MKLLTTIDSYTFCFKLPLILETSEQFTSRTNHAAATGHITANHAVEACKMVHIIFVEQVLGARRKYPVVIHRPSQEHIRQHMALSRV